MGSPDNGLRALLGFAETIFSGGPALRASLSAPSIPGIPPAITKPDPGALGPSDDPLQLGSIRLGPRTLTLLDGLSIRQEEVILPDGVSTYACEKIGSRIGWIYLLEIAENVALADRTGLNLSSLLVALVREATGGVCLFTNASDFHFKIKNTVKSVKQFRRHEFITKSDIEFLVNGPSVAREHWRRTTLGQDPAGGGDPVEIPNGTEREMLASAISSALTNEAGVAPQLAIASLVAGLGGNISAQLGGWTGNARADAERLVDWTSSRFQVRDGESWRVLGIAIYDYLPRMSEVNDGATMRRIIEVIERLLLVPHSHLAQANSRAKV